jgi:hypothetical protein
MTTDDKELLPSPFCGEGAAFGAIVDGSKNGRPFVNCVMCQASNGESLGFSNLEDAAEAWNTRREAADRIEQLSSALEFYAAIGNHIMTIGRDKHGSRATSAIIKDGGEIARSALQSLQVGGE